MSIKIASFVFRFFGVLMLLALLVGALGITPARATSWIVTTAADTNDSACDSDCSLREAIAAASAGDTITFDGDHTIILTSTLTIGKDLTIDGAGHSITVNGNDAVRVFYVNAGVTFNLQNLTVANGREGGLFNNGTVNVTNSTFSGNKAIHWRRHLQLWHGECGEQHLLRQPRNRQRRRHL